MTDKAIKKVKPSSLSVSGAVRKRLPPRYINIICTEVTSVMMAINALFFDNPAVSISLSVRALKQWNTEVNIKSAKNAVRRYILS